MSTELIPETLVVPDALTGVPWRVYRQLRKIPEMRNRRMTYLDGTLIIMSPEYIHENSAELLGVLFRAVASASGVPYCSARATTLSRKGNKPKKGSGKEPDTSFYVGARVKRMKSKKTIDLKVDPPPDITVEVVNKSDSALALPLYARFGVPEVWVYHARQETIWFGRLEGGEYVSLDRSLCLPQLTPELALHALSAYRDHEDEGSWNTWLQEWARALPLPPA
jgi:Uma2 family endonuclease